MKASEVGAGEQQAVLIAAGRGGVFREGAQRVPLRRACCMAEAGAVRQLLAHT